MNTDNFKEYREAFTEWHFKVIELFIDPESWLIAKNLSTNHSSLLSILNTAYPELTESEAKKIWDDLKDAGFHATDNLKTIMTPHGTISPRINKLGREFFQYVQNTY